LHTQDPSIAELSKALDQDSEKERYDAVFKDFKGKKEQRLEARNLFHSESRRALRGINLGVGFQTSFESLFDLNRPDPTSSPNKPLGAEAKSTFISLYTLFFTLLCPLPPFHPSCHARARCMISCQYWKGKSKGVHQPKEWRKKTKILDGAFK